VVAAEAAVAVAAHCLTPRMEVLSNISSLMGLWCCLCLSSNEEIKEILKDFDKTPLSVTFSFNSGT
jgi:hypothetical protein